MFSSKFDLYRSGWLELVFDDRNKEYGAYDLRKHYADNLLKAMGITFFGLAALGVSYALLPKSHHVPPIIIDTPTQTVIVVNLRPRVEQPKQVRHVTPPPVTHAPTVRNPILVTAPDPVAENPPTRVQLTQATIGTETTKGAGPGDNVLKTDPGPGLGTPAPAISSNEVVGTGALDVMPEPYGGAAAWAKFLQKNIRYPGQASDADKQGKVFLSFIIERDGHLSNIVVERGPGYGMDEEALRVLKLAPAWKPGKQAGQSVRVKYTIPINFVIPDSE